MNLSSVTNRMACSTMICVSAMALLAGCALPSKAFFNTAPTEIFYKNGQPAYIASCKSATWGPCLEKAGSVCKDAGYTILEQDNQRSYGDSEKELIFACKGKP